MSCPPLTRHTAASNSSTRALVLWQHRRGLDMDTDRQITHALSHTQMHSPGIPAVETERDLVHAARVSHHQVKTGLKAERKKSINSWCVRGCRKGELGLRKIKNNLENKKDFKSNSKGPKLNETAAGRKKKVEICQLIVTKCHFLFKWKRTIFKALPGSSWWLVGTLCRRVHHLSGWMNETSYASCSQEWSLFCTGVTGHMNTHFNVQMVWCWAPERSTERQ